MTHMKPVVLRALQNYIGRIFNGRKLEDELSKYGYVEFSAKKEKGQKLVYVNREKYYLDLNEDSVIVAAS